MAANSAPIALAAINPVNIADRGSAAALVTATRIIGMTVGLAALTAWGTDRFQGLVVGLQLPFALPGEALAQTEQRALEFEQQLNNAGLTLFSDFFFVAMVVCLIAVIPASLMAWNARKTVDSPVPATTVSELASVTFESRNAAMGTAESIMREASTVSR